MKRLLKRLEAREAERSDCTDEHIGRPFDAFNYGVKHPPRFCPKCLKPMKIEPTHFTVIERGDDGIVYDLRTGEPSTDCGLAPFTGETLERWKESGRGWTAEDRAQWRKDHVDPVTGSIITPYGRKVTNALDENGNIVELPE